MKKEKNHRLSWNILLVVSFVIGLLVAVVIHWIGIGTTSDSVDYLTAATFWKYKSEIVLQPFWPPLYPLVLSWLSWGFIGDTVSWVSGLAFGCLLISMVVFLRDLYAKPMIVGLAILFCAVWTELFYVFRFAWSEHFYGGLLALHFALLVRHIHQPTFRRYLLLMLSVVAVVMTRYIGYALLAQFCGYLVVSLWKRGEGLRAWGLHFGLLAVSLIPHCCWLYFNIQRSGGPHGRRDPAVLTFEENLGFMSDVVSEQLLATPGLMTFVLFSGVAYGVGLLGTEGLFRRQKIIVREDSAVQHQPVLIQIVDEQLWLVPLYVIVHVLLYAAILLYATSSVTMDRINPRYFSPLLPSLLFFGLGAFALLQKNTERGTFNFVLFRAIPFLLLGFGLVGGWEEILKRWYWPAQCLMLLIGMIYVMDDRMQSIKKLGEYRGFYLPLIALSGLSIMVVSQWSAVQRWVSRPTGHTDLGFRESKTASTVSKMFDEWFEDNDELGLMVVTDVRKATKGKMLLFRDAVWGERDFVDYGIMEQKRHQLILNQDGQQKKALVWTHPYLLKKTNFLKSITKAFIETGGVNFVLMILDKNLQQIGFRRNDRERIVSDEFDCEQKYSAHPYRLYSCSLKLNYDPKDVVYAEDLEKGDLQITEIHHAPVKVKAHRGEWFEIKNTLNKGVVLKGLKIIGDGDENFTVDRSVVVEPGGYALFAVRDDPSINGELPAVDFVYRGMKLNNSDRIELSVNSKTIDIFEYTNGFNVPVANGASIYKSNLEGLERWCLSKQSYGLGDFGTPRQENETCVFGD